MPDHGPDNTLPPVTADDYFAAVREVEAAERNMQDTERSHQPNSPTLLSADAALERAREKVTALEDRAAHQSGLQPHEAAAGVHFGADGTAYMVKERIADEIEAAYAERAAQQASPWHDVAVHWPNGTSHEDGIRGINRDDALANARSNWITENPYGQAEWIEYHGRSAEEGRAR